MSSISAAPPRPIPYAQQSALSQADFAVAQSSAIFGAVVLTIA
jgi:hypothetical protein